MHHERLSVPVLWWVLLALFAVSLLLAVGFYLGPVWGGGAALVSFAVMAVFFVRVAVQITVTEDTLRVGHATIERRYLGEVTALAAAEARRRRGPDADARAYLVLRPYISTAVEIAITDPDDPVPYWLIATRRPQALAAALSGAAVAEAG